MTEEAITVESLEAEVEASREAEELAPHLDQRESPSSSRSSDDTDQEGLPLEDLGNQRDPKQAREAREAEV